MKEIIIRIIIGYFYNILSYRDDVIPKPIITKIYFKLKLLLIFEQ